MSDETAQKIKIIHVDDHSLFRHGVKMCLDRYPDIEMIDQAENGLDLLNKLVYKQPVIVILNISMPVMNGLETLPILKQRYPGIKVIMLSMHNDPGVICKFMELGASSFLTKEMGCEQIYQAIIGCHKNWIYINDVVRHALIKTYPNSPLSAAYFFTEKDTRILKLLSQGEDIKAIGDEVDLNSKTVSAIIDRLKTKTDTNSVEGLLAYVRENGVIG